MVKKIDEQEFGSLDKAGNIVVDFSATWCMPCRMLAPVMEKVSEEFDGKVSFYNIDIDQNPSLAEQYGIQSIPAVAFIKDGKLADMHVGFAPKGGISSFVNKNLG